MWELYRRFLAAGVYPTRAKRCMDWFFDALEWMLITTMSRGKEKDDAD